MTNISVLQGDNPAGVQDQVGLLVTLIRSLRADEG